MALWKTLNYDGEIPDLTTDFQITTKSSTDVFDKPPSTHRFDAPIVYRTTTVGKFKSASVTVEAKWADLYDQGGLILFIELSNGDRKWLKTGIEFVDSKPMVSVVAKDRWADWSLRPAPGSKARVKIDTHEDGSLWVHLADGNGYSPAREVTWWGELDANATVKVGPFCAKPTAGEDLEVTFSDLEVGIDGESV